jgi:hypothetical protein
VTLTADQDTSWIFRGTAGFTLGSSSAATGAISVGGNDTVSVIYNDNIIAPPETQSLWVTWNP